MRAIDFSHDFTPIEAVLAKKLFFQRIVPSLYSSFKKF
jgi:hypothetical protein